MDKDRRGGGGDISSSCEDRPTNERTTDCPGGACGALPPSPGEAGCGDPRLRDLETLLKERTEALATAAEEIKTCEQGRDVAFGHAPFGFLALDKDLCVVYCNSAAGQVWNATPEDLLGAPLWRAPTGGRPDVLRQKCLDSLKRATPDSFEVFSPATGKWLAVHCVPSDGGLLLYLRDISRDKQKDETTAKLWREARSLADNSPDLVLRFDGHLGCTFANRATERLIGIPPQQFLNKTHRQMGLPREIAQRLDSALIAVLRTGTAQLTEFDLDTPTGKKAFSWRAVPETDAAGRVRSVLVVARNVTQQREEERIRQRLTAAIDEADEGVIVTEPDGTVTYMNAAFCRITGCEKTETVGTKIGRLAKDEIDVGVIRAIRGALSQGKPWSGRFALPKKGDGEVQCDLHASSVKDESGNITGFVGIMTDVTREVALEEQFREAQRLEALGTLAGGIAHDFNNMLAVIIGNTELALDDVEKDSPVKHYLKGTIKAALRSRDLVKQILSFSRKSAQHVKLFNLEPLIRDTAKLLRSTLPATTDFRLEIDAAEDTVLADPTQIQQILMNLATNASQAMGEDGILTIALREACFDSEAPPPDPGLSPGEYLVLSVRDTGTGIDEAVRSHIFEPFFTTKEPGKGTGLGLAVVYGIVKAHAGAVTVESAPGKGSTFRVFLPKGHGPAAETPADEPFLPEGKGRILFVDDEEQIAAMGKAALSRLGYDVQTETDPQEALRVFSHDPDRFDLVITDQAMPGMAGLTLARRLMEQRPGVPIILCTGYSATVDQETAKTAGITAFLMKPLTRDQLARAVKEALDGGPG